MPAETIGIIGAGSIGTAWAIFFASAGHPVQIFDADATRRDTCLVEIRDRLSDLRQYELLNEPVETAANRVKITSDLATTVRGSDHVQECVPEDVELKTQLFAELDRLAHSNIILASSTSFLPASSFASDLPGRARCLVVHPGNPPYLLRIAEIVPASFTAPDAVQRTEVLLRRAGMTPIRLGGEIDGFVFNRLQGALLREAYRLVRDGVAGPVEIDALVRDGLGLRWSVIGPFETADLNTRGGIAAHAARMGPRYARMGEERGETDPLTDDLVEKVAAARRRELPLGRWAERVAWRDRELMKLLRCRRTGSR